MKRRRLYLLGCFVVPHIMLFVGLVFLSKRDAECVVFGLKLCKWSTAVMLIGAFIYYVYFTAIFGMK